MVSFRGQIKHAKALFDSFRALIQFFRPAFTTFPYGCHHGVHLLRGGTPYYSLYGEAQPKMGIFFQASGSNKRVGISLVEGYKREGKSVISVCKRT